MNDVRSSVDNQGAKPPEVHMDVPEKPAGPFSTEQTKPSVKPVESPDATRKQREEKLDIWMENVKEFIRNIDVKSL
jgi:hypothetical protein